MAYKTAIMMPMIMIYSTMVWPFLTAITTAGLFIASIFDEWGVVWGSIPVAVTLIGWFWPSRDPRCPPAGVLVPEAAPPFGSSPPPEDTI